MTIDPGCRRNRGLTRVVRNSHDINHAKNQQSKSGFERISHYQKVKHPHQHQPTITYYIKIEAESQPSEKLQWYDTINATVMSKIYKDTVTVSETKHLRVFTTINMTCLPNIFQPCVTAILLSTSLIQAWYLEQNSFHQFFFKVFHYAMLMKRLWLCVRAPCL